MAPPRRKGPSTPSIGPLPPPRLDTGQVRKPNITLTSNTPIHTSRPYGANRSEPNLSLRATNLPVINDDDEAEHQTWEPNGRFSVDTDISVSSPTNDEDQSNDSLDDQLRAIPSHNDDDDEDDEDDDDEEQNDITPQQSYPFRRSQSTPFLVPAPPNAFAPPFYNRPPTPLPPSPSLTSLLRPTFSSRPTTPDDSETEGLLGAGDSSTNEAAVAKSARTATTVPRASPKVPTYEYYGFALYLTSSLCFLMYLLWSYLPSPFLHQLGIYYYPNRWWSLAVPSSIVMTLVYIYVALASYNTGYLTKPLGSVENMVDEAANIAVVNPRSGGKVAGGKGVAKGVHGRAGRMERRDALGAGDGKGEGGTIDADETVDWKALWNEGTDAVMDVPVGGVCEVLYGDG